MHNKQRLRYCISFNYKLSINLNNVGAFRSTDEILWEFVPLTECKTLLSSFHVSYMSNYHYVLKTFLENKTFHNRNN